ELEIRQSTMNRLADFSCYFCNCNPDLLESPLSLTQPAAAESGTVCVCVCVCVCECVCYLVGVLSAVSLASIEGAEDVEELKATQHDHQEMVRIHHGVSCLVPTRTHTHRTDRHTDT